MNVSNLAGLFRQGGIAPQNGPGQKLARPPAADALNRLCQNLPSRQERENELKARFDTVELSAEAANREESASMEELPEDILRYFLNTYKVSAYLSQQHEASLLEYRDQLSAFDQTIQEYQDMLDGKTALPDQMGREDVSRLLDAAREAREQFLQRGAEELNRLSENNPARMGYLWRPCSEGTDRQEDEFDTRIDASAGDIYGEIDRALANAGKVTATFQEWASSIQSELNRRGCGGALYTASRPSAAEAIAARPSLFQSIYEDLWNAFRQNTIGTERGEE